MGTMTTLPGSLHLQARRLWRCRCGMGMLTGLTWFGTHIASWDVHTPLFGAMYTVLLLIVLCLAGRLAADHSYERTIEAMALTALCASACAPAVSLCGGFLLLLILASASVLLGHRQMVACLGWLRVPSLILACLGACSSTLPASLALLLALLARGDVPSSSRWLAPNPKHLISLLTHTLRTPRGPPASRLVHHGC